MLIREAGESAHRDTVSEDAACGHQKPDNEENILNAEGMKEKNLCIWRRLNQSLCFPAVLEVENGLLACFIWKGTILKVFCPGRYIINDDVSELADAIHSEKSNKLRLYFISQENLRLNLQLLCWSIETECSISDPVEMYGTYLLQDLQLSKRDIEQNISSRIRADLVSSLDGEFVLEQKAEYLEKKISELPSFEQLGLKCEKIAVERIEKYGPSVAWSEKADQLSRSFGDYNGNGEFLAILYREAYAIRFERMGSPRTKICGFAGLDHSAQYYLFGADHETLGIAINSYEKEKLSLSVTELNAYRGYNLSGRRGSSEIVLEPNTTKCCYVVPAFDASISYEIGWWTSPEEFKRYIYKRVEEEEARREKE